MSDIIIRGMEMPITCCHCKMIAYNPETVWNDNGNETQGAWVCLLTAELIDNTKREEHCPLVELPPHGRLIDAEELERGLRQMAKYQTGERQQGILGCCETIRLAKTIIPASETESEVDCDS